MSCLGRCDVAPAVAVDDRPAPVTAHRRAGRGRPSRPAGAGHGDPPGPDGRGAPGPTTPTRRGQPRYQVLRSLLAGDAERRRRSSTTLTRLRAARHGRRRLPDRAASGRSSRSQPATPRYVVCNADESEPGTFKDRQILADQPHLVLEGLLLGMVVVGAEQGWVFVRHEYGPEDRGACGPSSSALRAEGLLGDDVLGTGRRLSVEVFVSPGGYILGEESALLECMEGHRGEPRNKPPFPGAHGLWGRPTLMNSVETLADVPVIVEPRRAWWRDQGTAGSTRRLKFFAVSGHVERPGVYCVPMGTTVRLAAGAGRGHGRRRRPGRGPARRGVLELPRPRPARRPAGLRHAGRGGLDAGLRRAGGDGRGHRPAGGGDEHAALLPRRVLRQVRPLPGRVDQGAHPPRAGPRRRRGGGRRACEARVLELERSCAPPRSAASARWPSARSSACWAPSAARRWRARSRAAEGHRMPGHEFFTTITVARRCTASGPPGAPPPRRVALADALHRVPAEAVTGAVRAARVRPVHRRRVRGAGRRHLRRVGRAAGLPRRRRDRSRWAGRPRSPSSPARRWPCRRAACCPHGADAVVMVEHTQETMPGHDRGGARRRARRRDGPRRRGRGSRERCSRRPGARCVPHDLGPARGRRRDRCQRLRRGRGSASCRPATRWCRRTPRPCCPARSATRRPSPWRGW